METSIQLIWKHISKTETVSVWFGYQSKESFQITWKLYPNKIETVSILETCIQIKWKRLPFWKLFPNQIETFASILDTSQGYPKRISGGLFQEKEYVVPYLLQIGTKNKGKIKDSLSAFIASERI